MKKPAKILHEKGKTWYTKEQERTFFFWATMAMLILWGCLKFFGS